ncbi:DMT family transporter [Ottowia sp.]|uniref:DMT family transporter n=1 Tax=Ottowia sp. TaxID=1898956 RepID=UPI0039544895
MRLNAATAALLTTSTLLWAGNAVVGRAVVGLVSPITLNFIRWCLAFCILLPLAPWVLRRDSGLWPLWRRYALLGLLGVGSYNALQYLALRTSTPVNVTLVASTMPLWMLALGRLFFGMRVTRMQMVGVGLSMAGVLVVLARGRWQQLAQLHLVPGDLYMVLATLFWAWYSWLLPARPGEPARLRANWAALLLGQVVFGLGWSSLFAGAEWAAGDAFIHPSWPLAAALLFVALGPAVLAYRCWGLGVQHAGPAVAGFFSNLTPVFAAILSALFLGEAPQPYHGLAFALIVAGIWVAARR